MRVPSGILAFTVFSVLMLVALPISAQDTESVNDTNSTELWCEYPGGKGPGAGKRIVLIAGDDEYRSEEVMPMLGKILSQRFGFEVTVLFPVNPETGLIQPDFQTNIPGMHRIDGADLVVLGLRFRNLPDEDMKHFVDYFESGKPIIGFRTSTHAFRYPGDSDSPYKKYTFNSREWPGGFGQQVLGDTWISHHGRHKSESTRGVIVQKNSQHPILQGVEDVWGDSDVYGIRNLKDSATVLLQGQVLQGMNPSDPPVEGAKNNPMMPLAWVQEYERPGGPSNRIFCTTMGAATDFQSEGLRRLLVNACFWAMRMESEIPDEANVDYVDPYNPTAFGFGTAKKGMKPSDYDLKN